MDLSQIPADPNYAEAGYIPEGLKEAWWCNDIMVALYHWGAAYTQDGNFAYQIMNRASHECIPALQYEMFDGDIEECRRPENDGLDDTMLAIFDQLCAIEEQRYRDGTTILTDYGQFTPTGWREFVPTD